MRKTKLLSATALTATLGLLLAMGLSGQAIASTTISTATTAPVQTSTTGDLTVDSSGSITLTSGTAITVNSDNKVTLNGKIDMSKSADNSTGILVDGGHISGLTIGANITVTDDFTASDTTSPADGVVDAPFAQGTGRYGIHSRGTTPFTGNLTVTNGSTIDVEGNNSYGIRFENNVAGNVSYNGSIVMEGNNNTGLSLENGVTGNTYLSGSIAVHGQNAKAVNLLGHLGGSLIIDGNYTSSGYSTTSASSADQLKSILASPDKDLLQNAATVDIGANVDHGILIDAIPTKDSTSSSTDQDGDGLADTSQLTASLSSYGQGPALRIGSGAQNLTIGGIDYASSAVNPPSIHYGLDIRGAITGKGVYQHVNATAVQLGGYAGHSVDIANGMRISGVVQSDAFGGNATSLYVGTGATTPLLGVTGTIRATGTSATTADTSTSTTTYSTVDASTTTIKIADGATLPQINIAASGGIYAISTGTNATATAILDQSDTLRSITNKNVINASIAAADENGDGVADTIANRGIAIDTRGNTHGLTLTQIDTAPTDSDADKAIPAPYILGDILLGSGDDSISSSGGTITGNIDFGAGANNFTLSNSAVYFGKLTGAGTVAMDLAKAKVALTAGSQLNLTTLHVGGESELALTLDTAHPDNVIFAASGAAVFDSGAKLDLTFNNLITAPTTFKILTASSITTNGLTTTSLDGRIPYIYHADLVTNAGNTTLSASFRLKSQSEAGYSSNQYAALAPILTAVANDSGASSALLSALDKGSFDSIYNQYLPDYSGENLISLSLGAQSLNRSLGALTLVPDNQQGQWWFQEYGYKTQRKYGDTAGFDSTGFSFAGGREQQLYGNQMVGLYLSYTAATPNDTFAIAKENMTNSDVTLGAYWRIKSGPFRGWAHAGAGYTQFDSTRNLLLTTEPAHVALGKWSGSSASAGAGASAEFSAGVIGVRPAVTVDYYKLTENKHSETGGGNYFDLNVAQRDGHLLSSSALINISYGKSFIKPELWFGYKQNLSAEMPDTVVNFANGAPFTLTGGDLKGGGPVAGLRVSADNQYSYFGFEADYEKQNDYNNLSVALRARFQF